MQKPTSMTVLGILNICFAAIGLVQALFGIVMMLVPIPMMEVARAVYDDSTFLMVALGLALFGVCSKLAMLGSGVGLVKGKAWGRSLGNYWALVSIVFGLTLAVVSAVYILPRTYAAQIAFYEASPDFKKPEVQAAYQMMKSMKTPTFFLTVIGGVLSATVYQILFLILNNRQAVRDYLAEGGSDAGGGAYGHPSQQQPPAPPEDSPW